MGVRINSMIKTLKAQLYPYRPLVYWHKAGPMNISDKTRHHYQLMEQHLMKLEFHTVFELGIGEGHFAKELLDKREIKKYDSCDITPCRQVVARRRLAEYPQFSTSLSPFQTLELGHKYDLVLAMQCLMHIPAREIKGVVGKMIDQSNRYVVNMDYWSPVTKQLSPHCFLHDYEGLYERFGWKASRMELPFRQSIFMAVAP